MPIFSVRIFSNYPQVLVLGMFLAPSSPALVTQEIPESSVPAPIATAPNTVASWSVEGQLRLVDEWVVPAPMSGCVREILVREGQNVTVDQKLFQWDNQLPQSEYVAAVAAKQTALLERNQEIELRFAELTSQVRRAELQRSTSANALYEKSVSNSELDRLELLVQQAHLSAQQISQQQEILDQRHSEKEALAEIARVKLERSEVRSRMRGTVVEVVARPNQWLAEGAPVARIVHLERLRFEALVDYNLACTASVGMPVEFSMDRVLCGPRDANHKDDEGKASQAAIATANGRITFISPEINPVTGQVRMHAEIDNYHGILRPGMPGTVRMK
jgi:multidrug efflux pump subunit AcrA (membrane-fusion protein)